MRIATKLVVGSTVGMLFVLTIHAILTFRREMSVIDADRRQEGQRLAHAMSLAVGLEWDQAGKEEALALLNDVATRDSDVQMRWVDMKTPNVPRKSERVDSAAFTTFEENGDSQDVLHSYAEVRDSAHPTASTRGAIQITQVLSDEKVRVQESLMQLAFAVLIILLINAVLATLLSRRWVQRPVAKLLVMAENVGNGEFSTRATLTRRSGREFSELGSALNIMASRLQEIHTAREEEYQRRIASEAQLQHAERLITVGKLASGVAHEIGTPLNVITGHADMIRRNQVDAVGAVKSAEVIGAHAGRITNIIKQLLRFSRRSGPERAEVDLAELSKQASESMLSAYAHKRGVTLKTHGLDEPHLAFVDATQMQQVVSNLVMNGIQAMEAGGTLTIGLHTAEATPPAGLGLEAGEFLCLKVADTGTGISNEEQQHIFEPFFTTKDVGEGTGLGLSISYGIMRDHGGWIEVDSELGIGTTFSMFVPLRFDA